MLFGFVQNIFALRKKLAPSTHPIGVDFGADCLRLAQVQQIETEFHLQAAACAEVPPDVRADPGAHLDFFTRSVPQLLAHGRFRGRQAVLGLPASVVYIQNLAIPQTGEKDLKDAIIREAGRNLPFDPSHALLRHTIVPHTRDARELQVIVMAADSRWLSKYIKAAHAARLNVVGLNVQPLALLDCFARVYRRKCEMESTRLYIDIGGAGTRAMIARGTDLFLARKFPVGGDHFNRSVAEALGIGLNDARLLRIKLSACPRPLADGVDCALANDLDNLAQEIDACRRQHAAAFPQFPVERLVFVGAEARQRTLCKRIAKRLGLPGQTGDSIRRIICSTKIGIESAIDRRHAQPAWAAALGLSLGPATSPETGNV